MPRSRQLRAAATNLVVTLLSEQGCSEADIDRGLADAAAQGAFTAKTAFVLAMSRVLYSDEQLAAGLRFEQPG